MSVKLTILVDDFACKPNLITEHGLAILVAGPTLSVLFDAGRTAEALMHNADELGKDLSAISAVVVSHGHRGHAGAVLDLARQREGLHVHAHRRAFNRRWAQRPGQALENVSSPCNLERLQDAGCVFHPVNAPEMLAEWLILSGQIGGTRQGQRSFVTLWGDEMVPDTFADELCLFVRGRRGWVVVTGCCHRGLKNTLRAAKFLVRGEPITALFGGVHLSDWTNRDFDQVAHILGDFGNPSLYLCHCGQGQGLDLLQKRLPGLVHAVSAGTEIEF